MCIQLFFFFQKLKFENEDLKKAKKDFHTQLSKDLLKEQADVYEEKLDDLKIEISRLEQKDSIRNIMQLEIKIEELKREKKNSQREALLISKELDEMKSEFEEMQETKNDVVKMTKEIKTLKEELTLKNVENIEIVTEKAKMNNLLDSLKDKIHDLEEENKCLQWWQS